MLPEDSTKGEHRGKRWWKTVICSLLYWVCAALSRGGSPVSYFHHRFRSQRSLFFRSWWWKSLLRAAHAQYESGSDGCLLLLLLFLFLFLFLFLCGVNELISDVIGAYYSILSCIGGISGIGTTLIIMSSDPSLLALTHLNLTSSSSSSSSRFSPNSSKWPGVESRWEAWSRRRGPGSPRTTTSRRKTSSTPPRPVCSPSPSARFWNGVFRTVWDV